MGIRRRLGIATFLCILLSAGCNQPLPSWGGRETIDPDLPELPLLEHPREQDDKVLIRVKEGTLPHLEDHITELSPGPRTLLVVTSNEPPAASNEEGGGAIALWLRGRNSQRARLPQFTSGRVNPGTSQDWQVDLKPGEYLLSISYPADLSESEAVLVIR